MDKGDNQKYMKWNISRMVQVKGGRIEHENQQI